MADKRKLLGLRLRELRKRNNYTLAQLAEKIGLEPSSLGNIENGYNYPKISTLENLSSVLKCSIEDFFCYEHLKEDKNLLDEIVKMLQNNPTQIRFVYKMLCGMFE